MNSQLSALVNQANATRAKIYYQLNQLEDLTGLSARSLKYRMTIVKDKYKDVPNLLTREGRCWKIHYTLIPEFLPIYKKEQTNVVNHPWETLVTWTTLDHYNSAYHIQLIHEVKERLPSANIAYVIEQDQRGANHIHAVSDGDHKSIEDAVVAVLGKYIPKKDYRAQIEKLQNSCSAVGYIKKTAGLTII